MGQKISRFPTRGLEPASGIKQLWGDRKLLLSPHQVNRFGSFRRFIYHFFAQESQGGVEVGRLVGQQAVAVPAAAQVVLDHGFLHVHALHVPPGAAAGVQQAAQALRQRGQPLDAGHPPQRTVGRFAVHRPESDRASRGPVFAPKMSVG